MFVYEGTKSAAGLELLQIKRAAVRNEGLIGIETDIKSSPSSLSRTHLL